MNANKADQDIEPVEGYENEVKEEYLDGDDEAAEEVLLNEGEAPEFMDEEDEPYLEGNHDAGNNEEDEEMEEMELNDDSVQGFFEHKSEF
jgi:hypothetical protein